MGQKNDIWNRTIRHNLEQEPDIRVPSSFLPRGSANGTNRLGDHKPLQRYTSLVYRILKDHNMAYLYALDMELNDVISHTADYVIDDDSLVTEKGLKKVLASMTKKYPDIKTILKTKALLSELAETIENHTIGKSDYFDAPPQMQALAALQEHTQVRIEEEAWDGIEKVTAMFEGQLIACPEYFKPEHFNKEALTYLLANSNRNHADSTASAMARWEIEFNDKSVSVGGRRSDNPLHFAKHLRLAHWADMEESFDKWKASANHIQLLSPEDILTRYPFRYERCFWEQFMILRSDHALHMLDSKLDMLLFQWQEWLKDTLIYKKPHRYDLDKSEMLRAVFTIASLFVFGCYRKPNDMLDNAIVKTAVDKLLFADKPYGIPMNLKNEPRETFAGVALTAQIIHALYVANPSGSEGYIEDAASWLRGEQTPYGQWYDLTTASPIEISVLVLDAMHLAWGEGKCTIRRLARHVHYVSMSQLPPSPPEAATARHLAEIYGLLERRVSSRLSKECEGMDKNELSSIRFDINNGDDPDCKSGSKPKYMYYANRVSPILEQMKRNADQKRNTK